MHRRRSALSVSTAAALLLAAPLLTGCGDDAHPGAAAVVDGERITVDQVQSRAEAVRDAQRAAPNSDQLIKSTGPLSRYTLSSMIREKVVERAAEDEGVNVTRRALQEYRSEQEQAATGESRLRDRMLAERAVAPGQIDEVLRMDLQVLELAKQLGVDLSSPQAGEVMNEKFTSTAEGMGIDISPRFGEWSNDDVSLTGSETPWLKQQEPPQQQPA